MLKIGGAAIKDDREAYALLSVDVREVRDLDYANDSSFFLGQFATNLHQGTHINFSFHGLIVCVGKVTPLELKLANKILSDLIFFVLRVDPNLNSPLTCQGTPDRDRQKVVREQNILQEVFNILKAPFTDPVRSIPIFVFSIL